MHIVLASSSEIRQSLLAAANVSFSVSEANFDEVSVKDALVRSGAKPHDIALALASGKAEKVSRDLRGLVIGCDQVLSIGGKIYSKPKNQSEAREQLNELKGKSHSLLSAAVIYEDCQPTWSHVGEVRLTMRNFSDTFLDAYLNRNWPGIQNSVGGYKLEEEGVRLFSKIDGDYFTILGMPLVEILSYLGQRGAIDT